MGRRNDTHPLSPRTMTLSNIRSDINMAGEVNPADELFTMFAGDV